MWTVWPKWKYPFALFYSTATTTRKKKEERNKGSKYSDYLWLLLLFPLKMNGKNSLVPFFTINVLGKRKKKRWSAVQSKRIAHNYTRDTKARIPISYSVLGFFLSFLSFGFCPFPQDLYTYENKDRERTHKQCHFVALARMYSLRVNGIQKKSVPFCAFYYIGNGRYMQYNWLLSIEPRNWTWWTHHKYGQLLRYYFVDSYLTDDGQTKKYCFVFERVMRIHDGFMISHLVRIGLNWTLVSIEFFFFYLRTICGFLQWKMFEGGVTRFRMKFSHFRFSLEERNSFLLSCQWKGHIFDFFFIPFDTKELFKSKEIQLCVFFFVFSFEFFS